MVKIRRNHQPRQWQKVTYQRNNGGTIAGGMRMKVSEVPAQTQIHSLKRHLKARAGRIKRLIEQLGRVTEEHKPDIQAKLHYAEQAFFQGTKRLQRLEEHLATTDLRVETKRENEKKAEEARKENVKEGKPKYPVSKTFRPMFKTPGEKLLAQQKIEYLGRRRVIKNKGRKKTFDKS